MTKLVHFLFIFSVVLSCMGLLMLGAAFVASWLFAGGAKTVIALGAVSVALAVAGNDSRKI